MILSGLLLTSCKTFEQNLQESQDATSIKSMNAKQSADVNELEAGGQLTSQEAALMNQSINGSSLPAGENQYAEPNNE